VRACRLAPEHALGEFSDAEVFLADRGMLTLTPSCSLPSLFAACHEEPHSPGKAGYGQYPRTRWWWGGALEKCALATKLHRGKTLFLAPRVAAVVDPLCRAETENAGDHRLVSFLRTAGPSTTDDVKAALGWDAKQLKRERDALARVGVVLTRHLEVEAANGGHRHVGELSLWEHVVPPTPDTDDALRSLLVAAVDAAVIAPEKEVRTWFGWKLTPDIVQSAVEAGLVQRVRDSLATKEP
jgi:hypothetical protein